ncbi:unnamed protein product [Cyprideis torosa]|uniref:Uncharacterized protein n=1 Tax=Cyprideis torosa TaxID=163714 RepID=A0A7R8WDK9_9CRUS|nr:unnamed protein product [Cyprideis torosa]CAG0891909.1 unnamed protein product [Cyprideis torosa]
MKLALLLAAALLGNCFAVDPNAKFYYYRSNEPLTRKTMYPKQNANEYMDQILENLREFMILNGMDTLPLPDQIEAFSEEFLGITWHGEASLTQGYIRGLETIHRSGDAELDLLLDGGINMKTELGFNDMDGGYLMHVDFMGIGIDAYAAVWVYSLRMYMDVSEKLFLRMYMDCDVPTPSNAFLERFQGIQSVITSSLLSQSPLNDFNDPKVQSVILYFGPASFLVITLPRPRDFPDAIPPSPSENYRVPVLGQLYSEIEFPIAFGVPQPIVAA